MRTLVGLLLAAATATLAVTPAAAHDDDHREMDAHVHGVGQLEIALERDEVDVELRVPGADIVGFEHAPSSDADRAAIEQALVTLAAPLELFVVPAAAGCTVADVDVELDGDDDHDGHDEHADDEHAHSEFHADYRLTCTDPAAVSTIEFAYFSAFPNANELEVQILSDAGARAADVTRAAPTLTLGN